MARTVESGPVHDGIGVRRGDIAKPDYGPWRSLCNLHEWDHRKAPHRE